MIPMSSHPSRLYTLITTSARSTHCVPSTTTVRTLCVATVISRPRARVRFLDLLCRRRSRPALPCRLRLRANNFLLFVTFQLFPFPCPRSCLVFWFRNVGVAIPPRFVLPTFSLRSECGASPQAPLPLPAFHGGTPVLGPWSLERTV